MTGTAGCALPRPAFHACPYPPLATVPFNGGGTLPHPFLRKFLDPLKNCIFGGSALWDLYAWMRNGRFYGGYYDCDLIFFLGVGLVALLRKRVFSFLF